MIFTLLISLLISAALLFEGIRSNNDLLTNLGYSFLTGVITGALSSLAITLYFIKKNNEAHQENVKLLKRKNVLTIQHDSLENIAKIYLDIVLSLQSYFYTNPGFSTENGYYELCKAVHKRPSVAVYEETVISESDNDCISHVMLNLALLEEHIINRDFTKIDLKKELLSCLKFNAECMSMNGKIKSELDQIEAKIKFI